MSLSGIAQLVQVNGAHFSIADATKSLRSKTIILDTTSGTGAPIITSLNGNVHTTSNINAGYYHGNAAHLVSLTGAASGTYGGAGAVVASVAVNSVGRIIEISNVNIELDDILKHGNSTSNTIFSTSADIGFSAVGNVVSGGYVKAMTFSGDGSELTGLTGVGEGVYGSETQSASISVDGNGRITSITPITIGLDTFDDVISRGASTGQVVSFSNAGQAIAVTNSAGMISIANNAPSKSFSVGNKFIIDRNAGSGNTVYVSGNVTATNYYGNAKYMSKTTDVADGTYGSSTAIPAITITNGRVASIGTSPIDVSLQGVTDTGNTTTNTVEFNATGTSFVTSSKVGIANSAPNHTLAVADNFYVKADGGTVASYFSGDGANVTNIVGSSVAATHGSASSVPIITIGVGGVISSISNTTIAQTLQAVTENGATSNQTITLENATSLRAEGKVAVSTTNAPTHDFHVGNSFYIDDDGINKVVVSGRVSATDYVGDGGILSNISDFTSSSGAGLDGVFGSASKVPVITFDDKGRISEMSLADVQNKVNSATNGQIAVYSGDGTEVSGFSALTRDGSNMTLTGTFTADEVTVNGNLHVTGNTIIHDSVTIEDPILTVGNTNIVSTQSVGVVFSRTDANVAIAYEKSDDGQAINTLVFGYTTDTGVGADILINESRTLESKFYGNVVATANITSGDTITAASFAGDGSQLTSIDFGEVDNNAETRLAAAEADIQNLETSNGLVWSNISTLNSDVYINSGILTTLKSDHEDNVSILNALIADRGDTGVAISNLQNSNALIWTALNTVISDTSSNSSILTALKSDHEDNVSRISTIDTRVTDVSFSNETTLIARDVVIGSSSQFFFDEASNKFGISNASPTYELTVGETFYVDVTNDIVSTIGSNLHTSSIEVVGDSSSIEFKTSLGEDEGDCKIAKNSDGLVVSTGGDGSLAVAMTIYANTDARFESNLDVGGELTVSDIVFSGGASIQAAQISLDDVVAVSGTTTRAVTVGNLNATGTVSATVKNFNIAHPVLEGRRLIHACIETARADNIYMGSAVLSYGNVNIDLDTVNGMTLGTFEALHKNVRVFTTNESDWDAVKGVVEGSTLRISCQNGESSAAVSWLVAGTRTDIEDLVVEM